MDNCKTERASADGLKWQCHEKNGQMIRADNSQKIFTSYYKHRTEAWCH